MDNENNAALEQRNIDAHITILGFEDEDVIAGCLVFICNLAAGLWFKDFYKFIVYDWHIGLFYDSYILFYVQIILIMPVVVLLSMRIIKSGKTAGYIWNCLYFSTGNTGRTYCPFSDSKKAGNQEVLIDMEEWKFEQGR